VFSTIIPEFGEGEEHDPQAVKQAANDEAIKAYMDMYWFAQPKGRQTSLEYILAQLNGFPITEEDILLLQRQHPEAVALAATTKMVLRKKKMRELHELQVRCGVLLQ
jgi:hypothetical protein